MKINWEAFENHPFYDELITSKGHARSFARKLIGYLKKLDEGELDERQQAADLAIKQMGITFRVYTEEEGSIDRAWPFDIIPRVIPIREWRRVEAGLKQRMKALNLFIDDLYHDGRIIRDKVVPKTLIGNSKGFRKE